MVALYFAVGQARDAWLQADRNRYNGATRCILWKVFASRGLGMDARTVRPYTDGSAVPPIVGKYLCLLLGWMKWGSQFQESFQLGSISYFFVLYSINDKMTLNVHDFFP